MIVSISKCIWAFFFFYLFGVGCLKSFFETVKHFCNIKIINTSNKYNKHESSPSKRSASKQGQEVPKEKDVNGGKSFHP